MRHRHELTDEQWERLGPLLPPQKPRIGRPAEDHRRIVNGMLWIHATGAPWRDLPERSGPWQTVATRFSRWGHTGLWPRLLAAPLGGVAAAGRRGGEAGLEPARRGRHRDSGAPARRGGAAGNRGAAQQALGRSRGGFRPKLHLRAEGGGKPITVLLTAGQRHEQSVFEPLMEQGAVNRRGRGRPRVRPDRVVGDTGDSSRKVRRSLRRRGIRPVIARRADEPVQRAFDRERYRARHRVERLINRMKQFRRVATRYEKLAVTYLAMVTIAAILIWL